MLDKETLSVFTREMVNCIGYTFIYDDTLTSALHRAMEYYFQKGIDDAYHGNITKIQPSQFVEMIWDLYGDIKESKRAARANIIEIGSHNLPQFAYQYGKTYNAG